MRSSIIIIAGLLSTFSLKAQDKDLTFAEAVAIGLSDNVVMKNTRNSLRVFKADKAFQISSFTPNLGINSRASQTSGPQIDETQGFVTATTTSFGASIGSNLVLFNGNNRLHSVKASSYRLSGQELLIKRTEQDVINQVALQFLQVLLDQELLKIAEENLITQERTLSEINGFVEAGSRPQVDQYRQEADVKRFELLVIQAKNALTNDKASLSQILQLEATESFVVVKPAWNIDEIRIHDYDLVKLYQRGLGSRADYKRSQALADASRQDYKGAFNRYLPSLTGFVTFGSTYFDANNPSRPTDPFLQQLSDRRSTSYGLNVTIPLWDRLQARNNRVFNRVTLENANNDVENLEKVVKLEIQNAYNNFVDVKAGYAVSQAQHEAAKLAYETQQESYNVGLATQVELAIANEAYIGAQANLAQTGYRLLFQKILLDYATGVLTQESIDN